MAFRDSVPDPSALRKVESRATFEVWHVRSSTMRLDVAKRGVVALTLVGHGHVELVAPCLRRWDEALRTSERVTLLFDFWDMPGYDSLFRVGLTEWGVAHRARLEPIHLLARSPFVRMGASVANLALGGLITTHALRPSYEVAVNQLHAPRR